MIVYYPNFQNLRILEDMLNDSCLWQIPGWCDEARDVINCSNILEAAKNLINCSLFLGIPQIFIAALYQVLIPLENCLKAKQFVFKRCSKYIGNTSFLSEMKLQIEIQWQKCLLFLTRNVGGEDLADFHIFGKYLLCECFDNHHICLAHFFWKPLVPIQIL